MRGRWKITLCVVQEHKSFIYPVDKHYQHLAPANDLEQVSFNGTEHVKHASRVFWHRSDDK